MSPRRTVLIHIAGVIRAKILPAAANTEFKWSPSAEIVALANISQEPRPHISSSAGPRESGPEQKSLRRIIQRAVRDEEKLVCSAL